MDQNNPPLKPYLKWAGGKRLLLPVIKKHLPENAGRYTYYEPFAGAGAVFFGLRPEKAVINDSNGQLVLTYKAVKENVEALIALLEQYKKNNSEDFYYKLRNVDRDPLEFGKLTCTEKAARLIFLNKTCFNGLYRVNSRGFFNVPYGKNKNPAVYDGAALRRISAYLNTNDIRILNGDFEEAVRTADKNSFVYFDPPYHSPGNTGFTGYQADGFDEAGQERLRGVMANMASRGVKCLLSNSDTEFIRGLYGGGFFEIIPVRAKRSINSDAAGRGSVNEVLIKNWKG